jgi:hypothetical protein
VQKELLSHKFVSNAIYWVGEWISTGHLWNKCELGILHRDKIRGISDIKWDKEVRIKIVKTTDFY